MSHIMTPQQRICYLTQVKARLQKRICSLLAEYTVVEIAAMSPVQRELFADVLERLPAEIPTELVTPLWAALGVAVAA